MTTLLVRESLADKRAIVLSQARIVTSGFQRLKVPCGTSYIARVIIGVKIDRKTKQRQSAKCIDRGPSRYERAQPVSGVRRNKTCCAGNSAIFSRARHAFEGTGRSDTRASSPTNSAW